VYSLGVVLYELLGEKLPYEVKGVGGGRVADAVRAIRESEPLPLSSVNRAFRGDLETIAGKALEKERARRYQSVGELAADIRRYLKDEPIVARRPGGWYQLRRFARRHRAMSLGLLIGVAALAAGATISIWQAVLATKAQGVAKRASEVASERQAVAEREAEVAGKVVAFLEDSLGAADPMENARGLTVAEWLERAAAGIPDRFADQPAAAAPLHATVAAMFMRLERNEEAIRHANEAVRLASANQSSSHPHLLVAKRVQGLIYRQSGKVAEANQVLSEVLAAREEAGAREEIVQSLGDLALVKMDLEEFSEAESLLRRAIGDGESAKISPTDRVWDRRHLLKALTLQGKVAEAAQAARPLLRDARAHLDPASPWMSQILDAVASALVDEGSIAEAAELYREAYETKKRVLGPEARSTLDTMSSLAGSLQDLGQYEEAVAMAEECVRIATQSLGREHPLVQVTTNNLAGWLPRVGRAPEAVELARWLVDVRTRLYGDRSQRTLNVLNTLSSALASAGQDEEALAVMRTVWERLSVSLSADHPYVLGSRRNLAVRLGRAGHDKEADAMHREAIAEYRRVLGDGHPDTATALHAYARFLLKAHRFAEVDIECGNLLPAIEAGLPANHWLTAVLNAFHAEALHNLGRREEAQRCLEKSVTVLAEPGQSPPLDRAEGLRLAVRLYSEWGLEDLARKYNALIPAGPTSPSR
jgi:tetratricopeptide (TPR) repeat protein